MEILAFVPSRRGRVRGVLSFLVQVVVSRRALASSAFAVLLAAVPAPLLAQSPQLEPKPPATRVTIDPKDISDVTLRTGVELLPTLDRIVSADPNMAAVITHFRRARLEAVPPGLYEAKFTRISTKDRISFFIVPFASVPGSPAQGADASSLQHMAARTEIETPGQKSRAQVVAGSISTTEKQVDVREEHIARDGKILPGRGALKAWLKCSLAGCASAAGCLVSGPSWPVCAGLACGGSFAVCGALEILLP